MMTTVKFFTRNTRGQVDKFFMTGFSHNTPEKNDDIYVDGDTAIPSGTYSQIKRNWIVSEYNEPILEIELDVLTKR